jgi:hypothetical protein
MGVGMSGSRDRAADAAHDVAQPRTARCADGDPCAGEQLAAGLASIDGPAVAGALAGLVLGLVSVRLFGRA